MGRLSSMACSLALSTPLPTPLRILQNPRCPCQMQQPCALRRLPITSQSPGCIEHREVPSHPCPGIRTQTPLPSRRRAPCLTGWALVVEPMWQMQFVRNVLQILLCLSILCGGQARLSALSYLSHILVIIFVRKTLIASDGWGELWQPRTGWVRTEECGWVGNGVYGEVVFSTELRSGWERDPERKGPKTHLNEVYITLASYQTPPYMGKHTSFLCCPQKCSQFYN